jgi:hypothetical protein
MARYVDRLSGEAKRRHQKAVDLHADLENFQKVVAECDGAFTRQMPIYKRKYGEESTEIKSLKAEVATLQQTLSDLRVKEQREIITLETAPSYLLIPWPFGFFIMAGVLAGVGADLGVVRNHISELLPKLETASTKLAKDLAFQAYHQWGLDKLPDSIRQADKAEKNIRAVKQAWETIVSDLNDLHGRLVTAQTNVGTADLDFVGLDFDAAKLEWNRLAGEAAGYLQFQLIPADAGKKTVDEAMRGFAIKKAA